MPHANTDKRPLEGLRVLDLGGHVAGPLAALLLADQGADVLHIDAPEPAHAAGHLLDAVLQRNKRRETVDLKTPQGIARLRRLAAEADVLIENFAPGSMRGLGLDYDACRQINPQIVYLSLPGFAGTDTELSGVAGWEPLVAALTGLFTNISFTRDFLGLPPVYTALKLPSFYAAVHGATAIMMTLFRRPADGEYIEVPLAAAMMSAMGATALSYAEQPERYDLPPVSRAFKSTQLPVLREKFRAAGEAGVGQALAMASALTPPMMTTYRCSDGRSVYVFAMDHAKMSKALLRELGILAQFEGRLTERDAYEAVSVNNNLIDVGTLNKELKDEIRAAMVPAFLSRSSTEWERLLSQAGVACAVVRSTGEWIDDPHVRQSALAVEVDDPTFGRMIQPGPSVWLDGSPDALVQPRPRQPTNQDAGEWFPRERDWNSHSSEQVHKTCLAGIRVLDLSTMIAGPSCARTLAEYGAEVIKVDPVKPHLGPRMSIWYSPELNQGKSSVLLDLKSPGGREALFKLIEAADVLVHNMRPGVFESLGFTREELQRRQPKLILTNITAYRGPVPARWDDWPGYDPVVQAASGVAARYGSLEQPEIHAVASTIDYLTGYLAAFGTAVALASRGAFRTVRTSLAQASMLAQLPYSVGYADRTWREASGQMATGESPSSRLYRTSDGWVFLHAPSKRAWKELAEHARGPAMSDGSASSGAEHVATWSQARGCSEVVREAARFGVQGARVQTLDEALAHRTFDRREAGLREAQRHTYAALLDRDHVSGTCVRTLAPLYARLVNRPIQLPAASPRHGSATVRELRAAGVPAAEVARLLEDGAAAEKLSPVFLPS